MKVILLEDYKGLGLKRDIVNVKDGYACNFLIPKGIARQATPAVLRDFEIREKSENIKSCLLYTSPSPRDRTRSRMPSSA